MTNRDLLILTEHCNFQKIRKSELGLDIALYICLQASKVTGFGHCCCSFSGGRSLIDEPPIELAYLGYFDRHPLDLKKWLGQCTCGLEVHKLKSKAAKDSLCHIILSSCMPGDFHLIRGPTDECFKEMVRKKRFLKQSPEHHKKMCILYRSCQRSPSIGSRNKEFSLVLIGKAKYLTFLWS